MKLETERKLLVTVPDDVLAVKNIKITIDKSLESALKVTAN